MKFLAGLLAIISSFFAGDSPPKPQPLPLNTAIVAYHQTYFAPAVAEPGNFPWAKKTSVSANISAPATPAPVPQPTPPTPTPPSPPPPPVMPAPVLPPVSVGNLYLANPEPIMDWYMPITIQGSSVDGDKTLPEMTFNREFWRIEVLAYWAPGGGGAPKPPVEKNYFKLEVYEKGTDKLIYTMTSGIEDSIHKSQVFKKPGIYYFKTYLKNPSQFEITFTFSGKAAE